MLFTILFSSATLFCSCQSQETSLFSLSNDSLTRNTKDWPSSIALDPFLLASRYNWNIPQLAAAAAIPSVANLSLASNELELQEEFAEETTPRSLRQVGTGTFYRNSNYNPALNPSYNPYDPYNPLNTRSNPLSPNYNPLVSSALDPLNPREDDGLLDAFTARRASNSLSLGRETRIRFDDTLTQLGTSWNPQTSEFSPILSGIFFFTFHAVTDRYTHFRISLQLNGGDVVSAFGDVSGYQMAGNSALVRMVPGDRAYLVLQEGRLFDVSSSRAYTTFSGFRIL